MLVRTAIQRLDLSYSCSINDVDRVCIEVDGLAVALADVYVINS